MDKYQAVLSRCVAIKEWLDGADVLLDVEGLAAQLAQEVARGTTYPSVGCLAQFFALPRLLLAAGEEKGGAVADGGELGKAEAFAAGAAGVIVAGDLKQLLVQAAAPAPPREGGFKAAPSLPREVSMRLSNGPRIPGPLGGGLV